MYSLVHGWQLEQAALRVIEYLYWTRDLGLFYEAESGDLRGFSDSDWAVGTTLDFGLRLQVLLRSCVVG